MPDRVISSLGRENEGFLTHFTHTAALTRSSCRRYFVDHQGQDDALHAKKENAHWTLALTSARLRSLSPFSGEITSSLLETYSPGYFLPINYLVEIGVTIDKLMRSCSFIFIRKFYCRTKYLLPKFL